MKLVGFLQIFNEDSKGNLKRCLDSMSEYCDAICVYDDASTDDSVEVALTYSKVKLIRGKVNEFGKEIYHKQELLDFANLYSPDWIFWLDADEVIEKKGEQGGLRELCNNADTDACDFRQINFWRSERYYRVDGQYNAGVFCRLWRANLPLKYDTKDGLHQKPYPNGIHSIKTSDIKILHYGFGSSASIIDKYKTYKAHGQTGWALDRLVDERRLLLSATDEKWLGREPVGLNGAELNAQGSIVGMMSKGLI